MRKALFCQATEGIWFSTQRVCWQSALSQCLSKNCTQSLYSYVPHGMWVRISTEGNGHNCGAHIRGRIPDTCPIQSTKNDTYLWKQCAATASTPLPSSPQRNKAPFILARPAFVASYLINSWETLSGKSALLTAVKN